MPRLDTTNQQKLYGRLADAITTTLPNGVYFEDFIKNTFQAGHRSARSSTKTSLNLETKKSRMNFSTAVMLQDDKCGRKKWKV